MGFISFCQNLGKVAGKRLPFKYTMIDDHRNGSVYHLSLSQQLQMILATYVFLYILHGISYVLIVALLIKWRKTHTFGCSHTKEPMKAMSLF
jgi:hypothetical protein